MSRRILFWSKGAEGKESQYYKKRGLLRAPKHYGKCKSRIAILIRKYYKNSEVEEDSDQVSNPIRHHYFIISGGPGQSHSVWNDEINTILMMAPLDSVIYTMDMRGLGESTPPFPKSNQEEWQKRLFSTDKPGDLSYISINNIATDYALLRREVCNEFYPVNGRFILLGTSFGGLVAARIVHLYPTLFDWLIMDSPSTIKGRFNPLNDESFWNVYRQSTNSYSVSWLREAFDKLNKGKRWNSCTDALTKAGWPVLWDLFRPLLKGEVEMSKIGPYRSHSATMVPSLIRNIYKCKNPDHFIQYTIPYLKRLIVKQKDSNVGGTELKKDDSHSLDIFFNTFICINELFQYPSKPKICEKGRHKYTLTDQCANWKTYKNDFKLLKDKLYKRPNPETLRNVVSSDRTRIVVLNGGLDLVTPSPPTKRWIKENVNAPFKLWLQWNTFGHVIFPAAPCMTSLLHLTGSEGADDLVARAGKLRKCVKMVNRRIKPKWLEIY